MGILIAAFDEFIKYSDVIDAKKCQAAAEKTLPLFGALVKDLQAKDEQKFALDAVQALGEVGELMTACKGKKTLFNTGSKRLGAADKCETDIDTVVDTLFLIYDEVESGSVDPSKLTQQVTDVVNRVKSIIEPPECQFPGEARSVMNAIETEYNKHVVVKDWNKCNATAETAYNDISKLYKDAVGGGSKLALLSDVEKVFADVTAIQTDCHPQSIHGAARMKHRHGLRASKRIHRLGVRKWRVRRGGKVFTASKIQKMMRFWRMAKRNVGTSEHKQH
jgi:hypothetical protein